MNYLLDKVHLCNHNSTMSTTKPSKINQLLSDYPRGVVLLASWLSKNGYSLDLQKRYKNSRWLDSIGTGAMIRVGDNVSYTGAIWALQHQLGLTIHPGGRTALSLLKKAHYLELSPKKTEVFGCRLEKLPKWFIEYDWQVKVSYIQTNFLPADIGLVDHEFSTYTIKISSAARAMMECLYLAETYQDIIECYEIMEGLNNLRPSSVQQLLESCQQFKTKRLFLYMAEKSEHAWFKHIDLTRIDIGKGKRRTVENGVYIPKYKITVPKEIENETDSSL